MKTRAQALLQPGLFYVMELTRVLRIHFALMIETNGAERDAKLITYTVASLGPESWFVDSNKGTSGYSFHSLAEAERFAIVLAQRNRPSRVCILDGFGEVVTEKLFDQAAAAE